MDRVERRLLDNRVIDGNGCWLWTKSRNQKGYGQTSYEGQRGRLVHRLAAHFWLGFDLSSQELVMHRCDMPPCFNPDHLFVGTAADNTADMIAKGRDDLRHRGEASGVAKMTEEAVRELREARRSTTLTYRELGRRFGISHQTARMICSKRTWTHV